MSDKNTPARNFWASNIRSLRIRNNLSQEEMARELGISRSKLNAHENGQTVNPAVEDLFRFSEFFRLSIDTLLRTDISKLSENQLLEMQSLSNEYITGKKLKVLATTVDASNNEQIEFVSQKARAGYLAGFSDPEFISKLPVFHLPHLPKDKKFRMFPTSGDSMYPVPENALIIANFVEDWMSIKEETPCIVITRGEGIVFKLVRNQIKKNRTLLLESLNTAYAPYEINVGEILEIWQFVNYISNTIPAREIPLQDMARTLNEIKADIKKLSAKK